MKTNYFTQKLASTKIKDLGISLTTYYCGDKVAYKMYVDGKLLFKGADYKPSIFHSWDSLESSIALLSFLTVGVGDVEDEYFKDYSPNQLEWADNGGTREGLQIVLMDLEDEDGEFYSEAKKRVKHKFL